MTPIDAPRSLFALSTDELRAIARCTGAPLSSLLLEDENEADAPVSNAVALRSLSARGLISIVGGPTEPGAVRLSAVARQVLGPVLSPETLVEIEADHTGSSFVARHVVCAAGPRIVVLSECAEADVWCVLEGTCDLASTLLAVAELPDGSGGDEIGRQRLVVPAVAHVAADDAIEEDGDAVAVLVAAGVDREAATAWVAAVTERISLVEVRAARLLPDDVIDAAELRILSAGSRGTWIIGLHDADEAGHEPWAGGSSQITAVGQAGAAAALATLLGSPAAMTASAPSAG